MTKYKCFYCHKSISDTSMGKRIRCPYCGSKLLYKPRLTITHVKAR